MCDHCYCVRLPWNSEVSLAVMTLPAADSWVQGLEAHTARCVVSIVPLPYCVYSMQDKVFPLNLVLTYVRSSRVCA